MLLLAAPAAAQAASLPTHHVRPAVASGQAKFLNPLPATQTLRIGILLPIRDQAGLDQFLQELYDPSSPSYRHFLTVPEFTERFGPTEEDYNAVVYFAESEGMTVAKVFPNRLLIDVIASVATIESTFHLKMGVYQHPTESRTFFAPDREPTVDLNVPLWHIGGLDNYSIPRPLVKRPLAGQAGPEEVNGSGPGGLYLPSDMRAAYYGGTALTGAGQSVGLVEFGGYEISDVTSTFHGAATATSNGSNYILTYTTNGVRYSIQINNVLVDGATSSAPYSGQTDNVEAETVLDIAQPIGMAPGLQQVRVYIAPPDTEGAGGDYDIFERMAVDNIAKQLSCSWYWYINDLSSLDPIFSNFATNGQNLFVASGDSGAYSPGDVPYPQSDSRVVDVGGTHLTTSGPGGAWVSESGWVYSGGGITNIPIPGYQVGVANSSNQASTTYRNIPDVAMEGDFDNYVCVYGSCPTSQPGWAGTSFAAPRWAGYLALANQQEYADTGETLGFINALIYPIDEGSGYGAAFHDIGINAGNNDCCGQTTWYNEVSGYNLVTGWGSPNGAGLIYAVVPENFSLSVSPSSQSGYGNYPVDYTVTVTALNGYGTVNLSASCDYDGLYCSVSPSQITGSGTAELTVNATLAGDFWITVYAESGSFYQSAQVEFVAQGGDPPRRRRTRATSGASQGTKSH
jgi:subtilase family serine protease